MRDDAPMPSPIDPAGARAAAEEPACASGAPGPQIEELLVAGLDRYFAGRFDEAIHVWTRVLFIDRGHARARAYIERARLAQAERQREHDALLARGVDAMGRGDTGTARELLARSLRDAGPDDRALAAMARLDRLAHAAAPSRPSPAAHAPRSRVGLARRRRWLPLALILTLSLAALAVAFGAFGAGPWFAAAPPAASAPATAETSLPVIATGQAALVRARALQARGRLREAADALTLVPADDPRRAEADRLLAGIQDALLATVR